MADRSEDETIKEISGLPEKHQLQVGIVLSSFRELEQMSKHAQTNFEAGYKMLLLEDYMSALRCFEDAGFYIQILSRRYGSLGSGVRLLREYALCARDSEEPHVIGHE
jgi:hypothetical protein